MPTDGFRPVDEDRASLGSPTPTGVANQIVSRSTAGLGLYPGDDVIQQWVTARRNGQTLASMAAEYVITAARVSSATRLHGPFSTPGPRLPPGIVGVKGIAHLVGLSEPSLLRWVSGGRVPDPDFTTATGRKVWQTATITSWLEEADFDRCYCGARCVSLSRHQALAHRRPAEGTRPHG